MPEENPKILKPTGLGAGVLSALGMQQYVIDLGQEGVPEQGLDLVLMVHGGLEQVGGAHLPRGSMLVLMEPGIAAQMRANVKKLEQAKALVGTKIPLVQSRGPGG